jgi:apolipoprotein N-acyltransferase
MLFVCAVQACFIGGFAWLVEWLGAAGISRVVAAPVVWVSMEWLRTLFPLASPWAQLGYSQHAVLPVLQVADLGGIYLVSALLAFFNAAVAEIAGDGVGRHRALAAAAMAAVVATLIYGMVRLAMIDGRAADGQVTVGLIQGNIAQDQKWDRDLRDEILERYLRLSRDAAAHGAELVVWPEAAAPFVLGLDPVRTRRVVDLANETGTHLLVGAPGLEGAPGGRAVQYNRAWHVAAGRGLVASYDKIHLVPFGEYVPFGALLGWVDKVVETIADFGRGAGPVVFTGPQVAGADGPRPVRFGALICYEGIFPGLTRRFAALGADVLVNISNDAWYGRTSAPYQHMAMAAVRAVENRVPLVRATNTGISAVVDPAGRVRAETSLFEEAVVVEKVPLVRGWSLYRAVGDVFVWICLLATSALVALRLRLGEVLIR